MLNDTAPEVYEAYTKRLREMTTIEKAQAIDALSRDGRTLAMMGLRLRHPKASEEELRVRLMVQWYGREFALRVLKSIPDDAK